MGRQHEEPDGSVGVSTTGHNRLFGQPHSDREGPIAAAEAEAAGLISAAAPMGRPGPPLDRRSPFFVGVIATLGVALTAGIIWLLLAASQVLVLVTLALFLAIGLEPAASWLVRHGFRRAAAVATVLLAVLAVIVGFLAAAVPALVRQVSALVQDLPELGRAVTDNSSWIGRLATQVDLQGGVKSLLTSGGAGLAHGVLGVGVSILSGVAGTVLVFVLTAYFLADMPRIRVGVYRLFPAGRRPRAILIGDQILVKVGAYVLGNLAISLITGLLTFGWLLVFDVPYPLLLAIFVALVDLIPVVGSTIGGLVVALVALSVSVPVAIATVVFYVVYQSLEGYLLVPPIIGRAVRVPAMITAVGVVVGGAMLGLLGALIAIPVAAALLLILRTVLYPRLDEM